MSTIQTEICACDLCGSTDSVLIWDKSKDWFPTVKICGEDIHHKDVMCKNCGLVYKNPRMTRESLDLFYKEEYRKMYGENPESEQMHALNAYRLIVGIRGSLLDIGCAGGKLLNLWKGEKCGVEPGQNKPDGAYASIKDVPKKYDIVTMLNTLEHVYSPTETLQEIYDVCGKYLLISVPEFFNTNITRAVSAYLSNAHLYTFTRPAIRAMLKKCGFNVLKIYSLPEEIGNKLYILSEKGEPSEATYYKPDMNIVRDFMRAWYTMTNIKMKLEADEICGKIGNDTAIIKGGQ